jgi:hypothetical protein
MLRKFWATIFVLLIVSPVNAPFHPSDAVNSNAEITPFGAQVVRIRAAQSVSNDVIAPVTFQPPMLVDATVLRVRSRPPRGDLLNQTGDYIPLTTVLRF